MGFASVNGAIGFILYEAVSIDQSGNPIWQFNKYRLSGKKASLLETKDVKWQDATEKVNVFDVFGFQHDGSSKFTVSALQKVCYFGDTHLSSPEVYNVGDTILTVSDSAEAAVRVYIPRQN